MTFKELLRLAKNACEDGWGDYEVFAQAGSNPVTNTLSYYRVVRGSRVQYGPPYLICDPSKCDSGQVTAIQHYMLDNRADRPKL